MPRNPSTGVYTAPDNSWNPAVAGTVIDPDDWNAQLADYEAAFTDSLSRSGEGGMFNEAWIKGQNQAEDAYLNMFRVNSANYTQWENPLYYDNIGNFTPRDGVINIRRRVNAPTSVTPSVVNIVSGRGDNATFIGVSGGYFQARDEADVTASDKGVLYGMQISVVPIVDRNNVPYDDVACLVVQNDGTAKGTDAIYVGAGGNVVGNEWVTGVLVGADCGYAYRATGAYDYGLDFVAGSAPATFTAAAIRVPSGAKIASRNVANSADISLIKSDGSDQVQLLDGVLVVNQFGIVVTPGWVRFTGATSGNVTIKCQDAAGTYNFNLPTTAGTSGQVLTSAAGGSSPMTWTSLAAIAASGSASDLSAGTLPDARFAAVTTWSPTISSSSGTITTSAVTTARYVRNGPLVWFTISFNTADIGTASGSLRFTLPTTANSNAYALGRETAGSDALNGWIASASNVCNVYLYNGNFPGATGNFYTVSGVYETQ
jgi:hypothetical protein